MGASRSMKPIDFLHLQMELEGISVHGGSFITRLHPDVTEFPLILFASTSDKQNIAYFDDSLPKELLNTLISLNWNSFADEVAIREFDTFGIPTKVGHFRTYTFLGDIAIPDFGNAKKFNKDDPRVKNSEFNDSADEVYAIEEEGRIVSACVSSRQNNKCAEAWVFTDPNHRRKGFARQVVMTWAANLQRKGIIPFYSHAVENTNSANLAKRLNLLHVFDETVIGKDG
jgi:predicted GNAT family acetyltransferase